MRRLHYHLDPRYLRDTLRKATRLAENVHRAETELAELLREIDLDRIFVRYGHRSLRGYCIGDLNFTKAQAQRLTVMARQHRAALEKQGARDEPLVLSIGINLAVSQS